MNNYINISNFNNELLNQAFFYSKAQSRVDIDKILNVLSNYLENAYSIDEAIMAAAADLNININSFTVEDIQTLKDKASLL